MPMVAKCLIYKTYNEAKRLAFDRVFDENVDLDDGIRRE